MTVDEAKAPEEGPAARKPDGIRVARAGAEADTAGGAEPKSEKDWLMSQVVGRGNMQRAYSQVMRSRSAPGIDGMHCEDFNSALKKVLLNYYSYGYEILVKLERER